MSQYRTHVAIKENASDGSLELPSLEELGIDAGELEDWSWFQGFARASHEVRELEDWASFDEFPAAVEAANTDPVSDDDEIVWPDSVDHPEKNLRRAEAAPSPSWLQQFVSDFDRFATEFHAFAVECDQHRELSLNKRRPASQTK